MMHGPDLHIVAFAVPYPANYGGAIDVWNRIRALHRAGVKIHLHCFLYRDFKPQDAMKEVVQEVHYYPRNHWPSLLFPGRPYIVSSRMNPLLLSKLNKDKAPILFEGIHTTGFLEELPGRKLMLRAHNIEHQYYADLARESSGLRYLFYQHETLALERYECNRARSFSEVFTISAHDDRWYLDHGAKSVFIPAFHGLEEISVSVGRGKYILYQGDLSIEMNQQALVELLKNIPQDAGYPIVIAGRSGRPSFEEKLLRYPNLRREFDVSEAEMAHLIHDAQIVLVHSGHSAGMKVKIFPALYQGRFIAGNENSITHTHLDKALHIYGSLQDIGPLLKKFWPLEFSASLKDERQEILSQLPSDRDKAKDILRNL